MDVPPGQVRVELSPKPGFCIKSSTLSPGILLPEPSSNERIQKKDQNVNLLEPEHQATPIPQAMKVFVNIAWDAHVPPPPEGSEEAIQRAMNGEDTQSDQNTGASPPKGWYVPVIVSNGRLDSDKTGKPSLVFDCVYNSTIKSRTLRDPEFKIFLVELALQRIEAQSGLLLSRTIGTPNILCKGKLAPRTVIIPKSLFADTPPELRQNQKGKQKEPSQITTAETAPSQNASSAKQPLIEVLPADDGSAAESLGPDKGKQKEKDVALPKLRGILKKGGPTTSTTPDAKPSSISANISSQSADPERPLSWKWVKEDESGKLRVDILVPGLTPALVQSSTLDVLPRAIILKVPNHKELTLDLALSDAEITARIAGAYRAVISNTAAPSTSLALQDQKSEETNQALQLKRQRDFDVDAADAEWKVGSGVVSVWV